MTNNNKIPRRGFFKIGITLASANALSGCENDSNEEIDAGSVPKVLCISDSIGVGTEVVLGFDPTDGYIIHIPDYLTRENGGKPIARVGYIVDDQTGKILNIGNSRNLAYVSEQLANRSGLKVKASVINSGLHEFGSPPPSMSQ